MKKYFIFVLMICLFFSFNVYANPYKSKGPYGVNCTWYAWNRVKEFKGISLPAWGNAKTWYDSAKRDGYSVGQTPKKDSIVVWNLTSYGHVGYVERVSGDSIYVWDSDLSCIDEDDPEFIKCMEASVSEETDKACKKNARPAACKYGINTHEVIGYIYLDNVPKVTTTTTTKTTNITTTKLTTTEKVKSNNNYLVSFSINSLKYDVDKTNNEYSIDSSLDNIKIDATLEDPLSTLTGTGEYTLKTGVNDITITVKAENGDVRDYIIHINKIDEKEETKEKKHNNFIIIYLGIAILLFIIIVILFKIKHR